MSIKNSIQKKKEYKKAMYYIENIGSDISFTYNDKGCSVCATSEYFSLAYNEESIRVDSIDDVKTTKWFDGKCLNEIYKEVKFEW